MKSSRIIARMTALTAAMAMAGFAGAAQKLTADIVVVGAGSAGLSAAVQAAEKGKKVVFGGRLGEYKYYDMDAVIARALEVAKMELGD
jgi:UDP-galactopyranose mutase